MYLKSVDMGLNEHALARQQSGLGRTTKQSKLTFFPFPKNAEVVSHPVNAWKVGKAAAFEVPSSSTMTCIGIY